MELAADLTRAWISQELSSVFDTESLHLRDLDICGLLNLRMHLLLRRRTLMPACWML